MADPFKKISSQLLEAAMKAEFAELEQRDPSTIAASPHPKGSDRHQNNNSAERAAATAEDSPLKEPTKKESSVPILHSMPIVASHNLEELKSHLQGLGAPPSLPIDPLQLPSNTSGAVQTMAAPQPQHKLGGGEKQQLYYLPHDSDTSPIKESNARNNDDNIDNNPTQRSRRGSGTGNNGTPRSGRANQTRPVVDLNTRAEATKEKNRRAQQRFRHRQKDRLQFLECEVTRLRNLLSEKGIDPGEPIEDIEGAASPLECK